MITTRSESQTVKFRGVDDLVLVADEWNPQVESGAATAATGGTSRLRGTDSARPSILLLHGGGQNRFSWKNTGEVLKRYKRVLVPELNSGQLRLLLRATHLVDAIGLTKVQGRPFLVSEIEEAIARLLA